MASEIPELALPHIIREQNELYRTIIPIGNKKTCSCKLNPLNFITPEVYYEASIL